jgi:hypothetical protein
VTKTALAAAVLMVAVACCHGAGGPASSVLASRAPLPGEVPPPYGWPRNTVWQFDAEFGDVIFTLTTSGTSSHEIRAIIVVEPASGPPSVFEVPALGLEDVRWSKPYAARAANGHVVAFVEGSIRFNEHVAVRSFDGGRTWSVGGFLPKRAGIEVMNPEIRTPGGDSLDVVAQKETDAVDYERDPDGILQHLHLRSPAPWRPVINPAGAYTWHSDDLGATWSGPVIERKPDPPPGPVEEDGWGSTKTPSPRSASTSGEW